MRNELEQIQQIESYLNGTLPADERAIFETKLSGDAVLREAVELQRELMRGVGRLALQGKIRAARRHYLRTRYLKWGGFGSGFAVVVVAVLLVASRTGGKGIIVGGLRSAGTVSTGRISKAGGVEPAVQSGDSVIPMTAPLNPLKTPLVRLLPATPESRLATQLYSVNASVDTSIVTKGGMVLAIPAGSFVDEQGKVVEGGVDLVVREALDPVSILQSGLSTRSGDRWLETAGMFDLEASRNGTALRVNLASPIYARIPTDSVRKDMLLFTGQRLADGSIDWMNPREPEHFLIPVDIHMLDFYPPHYLDSIGHWGNAAGNRSYTDSLYFSLAALFQPGAGKASTVRAIKYAYVGGKRRARYAPTRDTIVEYQRDSAKLLPCGINPARIKAIWTDSFQNTLIATREFERRMAFIHRSADPKLLELYLDHVDLAISVIDSMAARKVSGELRQQFLSFADRREGRVAIGIRQMELLRNYYARKTKEYTAAIAKAQQEFWDRQVGLDQVAQQRTEAYWQAEWSRQVRVLGEQYAQNKREGYTVSIAETGWHNMDRYTPMMSSTYQSVESVSFQFGNVRLYDGVYCYLLPDKMSSFICLYEQSGSYRERLWPGMSYSIVAIAYQGNSTYFYSQNHVQPGDYPAIVLTPVDKATLDQALSRLGSALQIDDLRKENDYQAFRVQDDKRVLQNQQRQVLRDALVKVLFPCYVPPIEEGVGVPGRYRN